MKTTRRYSLEDYEKIPENDRKLFDLKIRNATYNLLGKDYLLDLGINRLEVDKAGNNDFWYSSQIIDQGDLSTYYGYEDLEASGLSIMKGGVYPENLVNIEAIKKLDIINILKSGYTYLRIADIPSDFKSSNVPINLIGADYKLPKFDVKVGRNPTFLLAKDGKPRYAVINGFLIDLATGAGDFKNAMIYRK